MYGVQHFNILRAGYATFIGLLFLAPWLGLVAGAAGGALSGKLFDIGIDDSFIDEVSEAIEPGDSALFLLAHDAQVERIEEGLEDFEYEFSIIQTNLSPEDETALRETFAAEEVAG